MTPRILESGPKLRIAIFITAALAILAVWLFVHWSLLFVPELRLGMTEWEALELLGPADSERVEFLKLPGPSGGTGRLVDAKRIHYGFGPMSGGNYRLELVFQTSNYAIHEKGCIAWDWNESKYARLFRWITLELVAIGLIGIAVFIRRITRRIPPTAPLIVQSASLYSDKVT